MTYDIGRIRERFPALVKAHPAGQRIHLDAPAGTQVPLSVVERMTSALVDANANMNGQFSTSRDAMAIVADAHAAVADLYNATSPDEIVFGPNMTTLTLMMARVLGPLFDEGDEIILTHMEHDGNTTPWRIMAEEHGLVVKVLPWDRSTYEFDLDELDALITPRTRFAALNHASNILGTINPVPEMVRRLKAVGALTFVDSVQYAPHGPIDVQAIGCDLLVSSSYKWYGPHQGVLWGRADLLDRLGAYKLRAAPSVAPGKFETGAQSVAGQAGVIGAVEHIQWVGQTMAPAGTTPVAGLRSRTADLHAGLTAMAAYEETLSARLVEGLQSIDGVVVHGITDPAAFGRRVPTVSWSRPGTDPMHMARALGDRGVFVWHGHNYALPVIEFLGLMDAGGVVRVGPTHYNTLDEIDAALAHVRECLPGR